MSIRRGHVVALVALAYTALYLGQLLAGGSWLYAHALGENGVRAIGAIGKATPLFVGSIFAARCVREYDAGTTVRRAWLAMSAWLGLFGAGQAYLSAYALVTTREPPVPSLGDPLFFAGYACVTVALVLFIVAYRASGFPVGRLREHVAIGAVACVAFVAVGWRVLVPIALADKPLAGRVVDVGYPLLDLVLLVPALVLLRITARFQGGRVWAVWASILAGIAFFTGGDILFAQWSAEAQARFGPLVDLGYVLGYLFSGYGAVRQHELLTT